jgi:hypothetical protein
MTAQQELILIATLSKKYSISLSDAVKEINEGVIVVMNSRMLVDMYLDFLNDGLLDSSVAESINADIDSGVLAEIQGFYFMRT